MQAEVESACSWDHIGVDLLRRDLCGLVAESSLAIVLFLSDTTPSWSAPRTLLCGPRDLDLDGLGSHHHPDASLLALLTSTAAIGWSPALTEDSGGRLGTRRRHLRKKPSGRPKVGRRPCPEWELVDDLGLDAPQGRTLKPHEIWRWCPESDEPWTKNNKGRGSVVYLSCGSQFELGVAGRTTTCDVRQLTGGKCRCRRKSNTPP
jgi:hypothetical protein